MQQVESEKVLLCNPIVGLLHLAGGVDASEGSIGRLIREVSGSCCVICGVEIVV